MFRASLKQFLIYAIGSVSQTALGFLLLPLYLRRLTPSEYGILSILLTVNSVVSLVAGAGILSGLSRLYYEQNAEGRRSLAGMAVLWIVLVTLLVAGAMAAAAGPVSLLLFGTPGNAGLVQASSLLLLASAVQGSIYMLLRLEKRAGVFVTTSLLGFIADLALKMYLIGVEGQGVSGYLTSSFLSTGVTILAGGVFLRNAVAVSLDRKQLRDLLTLGFPFIFSGFGMWVLDISDRLILNSFAGTEAVGIYSLAFKFASVFNIVLMGPMTLFWTPFIFSHAAEQGEEAMRLVSRRALSLFILAGGLLIVVISAGCGDFMRLFASDPAYNKAAVLVPFLSLGPFMYLMCYPSGSAILQSKQVRYISYSMVVAATSNVLLNLVLIPTTSYYGATAATVCGYLILLVLQYYWAQRVFPVSYDGWRILRILLAAAASIAIALPIQIDSPIYSMVVRELLALASFGALTALTGAISLDEIRLFYRSLTAAVPATLLPGALGDSKR